MIYWEIENYGNELSDVFGKGSVVTVDELADEYAFLTDVMSEKEFAEKAANLKGFISRLRIEEA